MGERAESYYQHALAICEQQLGASHPDTATSLNNLALLYHEQDKYAEAEPLFQRALAIREQILGPQQLDTATSLNNLAHLYESQGRYAEAEPLYQRALDIREQMLGPQHPDTVISLNDLARLYETLGKGGIETSQLAPQSTLHERYLIVRAIRRGDTTVVYEARDTCNNTSCAIKKLKLPTLPENEHTLATQNFLMEAHILLRLKHPNLPVFNGFFMEGASYFLVMEFIDGRTLEELLTANHRPFTERRVLGWARQLCDVLEYSHGQQPPVIFRNLKPDNIMLTRYGHIKLIGFGLTHLFLSRGSEDMFLPSMPGFVPLEQYRSEADERSDIYSLAMTLYRLMTGTVNDLGFSVKDVHLTYPQISLSVARVLEKATSLRPEDRYKSIKVFRRALLGIGTFRFENGGEAITPDELADLCAHYRKEAAGYLFASEFETWLQEIGEHEISHAIQRLRTTIHDPDQAVEQLIQLLRGTTTRND